ncbi:MAG: hypothetical protein V9G19_09255 [Tetrasphaera sp.]
MTRSLLVLPSPLLPALAYRDLAAALTPDTERIEIATIDPALSGGADGVIDAWSEQARAHDALVAHSNAGYLAPLVRERCGHDLPVVFLDAALLPSTGSSRLAPFRFLAFVAGLVADDGLLPPWTRWWTREELRDVIPDARFAEIDRACPRLPLSYFQSTVAAPAGWVTTPNAYLALGSTYADELACARTWRWSHTQIDGGHLHFLHQPEAVAAAVLALLDALDPRI